jgi:hypothetical protein
MTKDETICNCKLRIRARAMYTEPKDIMEQFYYLVDVKLLSNPASRDRNTTLEPAL